MNTNQKGLYFQKASAINKLPNLRLVLQDSRNLIEKQRSV